MCSASPAPAAAGPVRAPERVLLVACGALAQEIVALRAANGWAHLDLHCLPAILHNRPERIPAAVRDAVLRHRATHDRIFVVYADCGTGGRLAQVCAELGVAMIPGPHCYAFFEGTERFVARAETEFTAFYLTDFLVRQFDAFVIRPLGLDRHPELRDAYFGGYDRLVHLAQTDDAELAARARACADRLGLAHERRFTGYGELTGHLAGAARSGLHGSGPAPMSDLRSGATDDPDPASEGDPPRVRAAGRDQ